MKKIQIHTEFIKLDQFMKLTSLVTSGSEAKALILEGYLFVNNQPCIQRGKKLRIGDIIEFKGQKWIINDENYKN
ncbi:MAG: RNA-binding protein [Candidatus Epulonipiscium fishelsonii]|nr:MAG: RNA-binding protein [Epulopiscium sp. AS2M-Bin002]